MRVSSTITDAPILVCQGMRARYSSIEVVHGVDVDVRAGEMVALLGSNGAGKSSLLGAIAGTISGQGSVQVRGIELGKMPAHQRAHNGLAFVPEQRGNIFSTMSVAENIELGLRLLPPDSRKACHDQIVELFPILAQRSTTPAGVLSGGEQQMLAIGIALGRNPAVLLLDEPTQGLAPAIFDVLENAFNVLRQQGIALLLAEQNVPFAERVADRYIVLSHGETVQTGMKEDLRDLEGIARAFMGVVA
jgi:ABC-type branched-subunit amino acid transport system ATPase component